ncbi:hypothetical protein C8R45DRAFT_420390 [Mycena sanguinolenta]|nr:hypothetical protein C8R45DRAFT_420390 [Mycena sanguinolenta]
MSPLFFIFLSSLFMLQSLAGTHPASSSDFQIPTCDFLCSTSRSAGQTTILTRKLHFQRCQHRYYSRRRGRRAEQPGASQRGVSTAHSILNHL